MSYARMLNITTLSLMLILTGCFGLAQDDGVIDDATATESVDLNTVPVVEGSTILEMASQEPFVNDGNDCTGILFHGAVDVDGDAMTLGWDTNLDGSVDEILTSNSGVTEMSIPTSQFAGFMVDGENVLYSKVALIATDSNGAKGVDLVDILCVEQYEEDSTGDTLDTYVWSAVDGASGDTTNATGEDLVRVQMDGGQELNWAVVEITITVNGATPQSCGTDETGTGCWYYDYQGSGDAEEWSTGEGIIISEGSNDICDGDGACFVAVNIVKKGAGSADDKTIGAVSASA